jgi:hypothetical protein
MGKGRATAITWADYRELPRLGIRRKDAATPHGRGPGASSSSGECGNDAAGFGNGAAASARRGGFGNDAAASATTRKCAAADCPPRRGPPQRVLSSLPTVRDGPQPFAARRPVLSALGRRGQAADPSTTLVAAAIIMATAMDIDRRNSALPTGTNRRIGRWLTSAEYDAAERDTAGRTVGYDTAGRGTRQTRAAFARRLHQNDAALVPFLRVLVKWNNNRSGRHAALGGSALLRRSDASCQG